MRSKNERRMHTKTIIIQYLIGDRKEEGKKKNPRKALMIEVRMN